MIVKEEIAQRFEKWDDKNWSNIEKQISSFQKKVADIMVLLGSNDYNPSNIQPCNEDQCVIGEEIYNDIVRPGLVKIGYLPKEKKQKKPAKKESSDSQDEEQKEQKPKVETKGKQKEKEKQKKGGKKQKAPKVVKPKKQDLMKQQIVKTNFAKEIQFVFNSFNPDKLTVDFGFSQKKLELKISTFFYVAWYIRKHKATLGLDESLVFELINILIKVIRIFKTFQGKSFINSSQNIRVSTRFLQDIQDCMQGLKEYYKYSAQDMMVKYPRLVYYTNYDQYFPTLDIKPYPSQIDFVNTIREAITKDKPTLIFYKTMIGSGKTSTAISLSSMIRQLKFADDKKFKNLQLIYCCIIKSVRSQVGKLAYNTQQKFALGTMDTLKNPRNIQKTNQQKFSSLVAMVDKLPQQKLFFPRIINSFSTNEKIVDLIISDLYTTRAFFTPVDLPSQLKVKQIGQLERQNVIMFLDQPTAFCGEDSSVTKKIFQILGESPPKVIVFASATMPQKEELEKTIALIKQRNPNLEVKEVSSKEFQIGCQFCTFEGDIIFPHSGVKNKQQLESIIELVSKNPFLMRLYTGPSLFHLVDKCRKAGVKKVPKLQKLSEIRQPDILRETMNTLEGLKNEADNVIEQVCKVDRQLMNVNFEEEKEDPKKNDKKKKNNDDDDDDNFFGGGEDEKQVQQQKQKKIDNYVNLKKLLRGDAHKFLGGCLIATEDPIDFAKQHFSKWIQDSQKNPSVKKLMAMYERDKKLLEDKLNKIDEDKNMKPDQKSKKKSEIMNEQQPKFRFPDTKRINTFDHYMKYCKHKNASHNSMLIRPIVIEKVGEDLFSQIQDWVMKLLFCGVAIYSKNERSSYYLNKVEELASANFLAYIICDESLCYGTNFPISNVILTDTLAQKLSMNEMFQLIGRAGRVGQSWTARAFLQKKGVEMLKRYISEGQKALSSEEARIFESLASSYIQNPSLELKSKKFYIRYSDDSQKQIQVIIRQEDNINDCEKINSVVALPYRYTDGKLQVLVKTVPLKGENDPTVYLTQNTKLIFEDLPVIEKQGAQVLNVQLFYTNEEGFIAQLLKNALNRIILKDYGQNFDYKIKNPFTKFQLSKSFSAQNYVFLLQSKADSDWKPYQEIGKQKPNQQFLKAIKALQPLEQQLTRSPGKFIKNSPQFFELTSAYTQIKKNYPVFSRQFEHNISNSSVFKEDEGMQPYEAMISSKYMSTLDEKDFAVDHRVFQIWNKLPGLTK